MRSAVAMGMFCMFLFWFATSSAIADPDDPACWVETEDGGAEYVCDTVVPGKVGDPGPDGSYEPTCDLELVTGGTGNSFWCEGENACFAHVPSALYPDGDRPGAEPRPSEDAVFIYKKCVAPDGTELDAIWTWHEPPEPPIDALARRAYGQLNTPAFTLAFNPPQRSYVFLDTWWGADGAGTGEIVGTSALGVVAIGEPDHIEVNPGDGSGVFECPWTTEPSEACSHSYVRASVDGSATSADGSPAYPAEARLVYTIRFEQAGTPLDVAGMPETLESPWVTAAVPVAEVQTTVTR